MKYEVNIVRFRGRKMFECRGIKILVDRWNFLADFNAGDNAKVAIQRAGRVYDSGRWATAPDAKQNSWRYGLVGLKRKVWRRDGDYVHELSMKKLRVGDVIVVETPKKIDPLYSRLAGYLRGWWPRTKMFRERFPYKGLTHRRKNARSLRRTWNKRVRWLRQILMNGEMPYLNFADKAMHPYSRPCYRPNQPKKIISLSVVHRAGRNYFQYQGCFFDNVNAYFIPEYYAAHVRVMRDGKMFTCGYLGALGKTGEVTGFEGFEPLRPADKVGSLWWFENFRADMLLPGDTLELESSYEWDLLDSVVREYCHSRLANWRVKRIRRHYPPEKKIEKMAQRDYYFKTNLRCAFGWDLVDRVRRLINERKIVHMRFEKQRR